MKQETKDKIAKIYELVNRGEAGEKEAAKHALDKLMKKYNLSTSDIESIKMTKYDFKYSNNLEQWLLQRIIAFFLPEKDISGYRQTFQARQLVFFLEYVDYIVIFTAFEYFRRHMMAQYKKIVLPQVKRCRSAKTKNARRAELQEIFFSNYVIASKLYKEEELTTVDLTKVSAKERDQRKQLRDVEGGKYHTPITTGLYLE